MDRESFEQRLTLYGVAWRERDAARAASLYAEDATYQVTPFQEPFRGLVAIQEYWKGVTSTEENIEFEYEEVRRRPRKPRPTLPPLKRARLRSQ